MKRPGCSSGPRFQSLNSSRHEIQRLTAKLRRIRAGLVVQAAPVSVDETAGGIRDQLPERRNAVLQRHRVNLRVTDMAAETSLREITKETVRLITALDVGPDQDGLVAPNSVSIAEAHFEPKAWFRAIYFGDEPAGFAMVWRDPDERLFYIWRFMVDARFQGKGVGRRALELLLDEARADGVDEVTLSVVPGPHSALAFYERCGFAATGEMHGGEAEMKLTLASS